LVSKLICVDLLHGMILNTDHDAPGAEGPSNAWLTKALLAGGECASHYERRVGGNGHDILVLTNLESVEI